MASPDKRLWFLLLQIYSPGAGGGCCAFAGVIYRGSGQRLLPSLARSRCLHGELRLRDSARVR